jgi:arylsulfatase A-like enzyme
MIRITSFGFIVFALFLFMSCDSASKKASSEDAEPKLPNIIYILADDLGYADLSVYGQKNFSTPNIDQLAQSGMLFTQHYSGSTVCAPSRSALMTGMHTGHTYIRGNKEVRPEGQHPIPDETYILPEMLRKQGYTTGAFGKWGLGFPGSEGDPMSQGFDRFYGYNCQRLGHHYYPYHLWDNNDSIPLTENSGFQKGVYGPELIHNETLAFIEENKDNPFFLYVASIIPHAELVAPEAIMEKYRGKFLPEKEYKGTDKGANYRLGPYESQKESHAAFVAMIEILDTQVGEIMEKVKALGIENNTIIVFTSDNGPHTEGGADPEYFDSNGPLKGTKRDLYEGGIRVPMIVKWPAKIEANTKSEHISAFWDIFPTFAEIAGAEVSDGLDGISFLPTLTAEGEQENHEYLYWEFHERGGRQAIRRGDWKAVKYEVLKNPNKRLELYDLSKDISESNDLAAEHPEIVTEMEALFSGARTHSEIFTFGQDGYLQKK